MHVDDGLEQRAELAARQDVVQGIRPFDGHACRWRLQVSDIRWRRGGLRGSGGREGESVHRRLWRHGLWTGHEHVADSKEDL
ncbi:hypothetical protein D3C72_2082810 [compost metagenome]